MARFRLKNDIFEGTIQYRYKMGSESQFIYCYQLISTPGHPNGSEKTRDRRVVGGADKPHLARSLTARGRSRTVVGYPTWRLVGQYPHRPTRKATGAIYNQVGCWSVGVADVRFRVSQLSSLENDRTNGKNDRERSHNIRLIGGGNNNNNIDFWLANLKFIDVLIRQ